MTLQTPIAFQNLPSLVLKGSADRPANELAANGSLVIPSAGQPTIDVAESVGASVSVVGGSPVGASSVLADRHVGPSLAAGRLDSYPLAATHGEYVPGVMAHLRDLEQKRATPYLRPLFVTLTAPSETDDRAISATVDIWADIVAGYGRGSGVLLAEGRGDRKGTHHWHGLALTVLPERWLTKAWVEHAAGSTVEAQRIVAISTAGCPLGAPQMEGDISRTLAYAFRQHTGSDIAARGGLATCWREAVAASRTVSVFETVPHESASSQQTQQAIEKAHPAKGNRRQKGAKPPGACEYCGEPLEGRNLRRDALYCGKSCRNQASRKRMKARGQAA